MEGLLGTGPGTSTASFLQLPLPAGSPRSYSRNTSRFLCFSFTRSQSTFASLVGHLGLIRMTAEQSQPLTPGHPGVGAMPASLRHSRPDLVPLQPPLWAPLSPSLSSWSAGGGPEGPMPSQGPFCAGPCPALPDRSCFPTLPALRRQHRRKPASGHPLLSQMQGQANSWPSRTSSRETG